MKKSVKKIPAKALDFLFPGGQAMRAVPMIEGRVAVMMKAQRLPKNRTP